MDRLIPAAVLALGLVLASPAGAQEEPARELPVLLQADEITHDKELGLVVASGDVEIAQGERILLADTVTYNQPQDRVSASGNVVLLEPTGEVLFADFVELSDEMKNGVVKNLRVRLTDNSRIAASGGRRTDGVRLEMRKAVFSPCQNCKAEPEGPPLWQIRAAKVVHNKETRDIEYFDAFFDVFGVPVAYTPFFSHPDPTVKRRTGLLAPGFGTDGNLGTIVELPFYYNIAPDKDATFTPMIVTDQDVPLFSGEYRQRFTTGEVRLSGSLTQADRTNSAGLIESDKVRGHIDSSGRFVIDDTWRWGFNLNRATDETFLNLYGISDEDVLTSTAFLEGFRGRNYLVARAYDFQDLRLGGIGESDPVILPVIEYDFHGQPSGRGDYWTLNTNLLSLSRTNGTDSRRLSVIGGWHLPHTGSTGQIYDLSATVRGDVYFVNDLQNLNNPSAPTEDEVTGRFFPQLKFQWRYPFIRSGGGTSQFIEPVAGIVIGPNGGNPEDIPNEDSRTVEFDDTNLFSPNRFPGRDLVDGGQRIDYGVRAGAFTDRGNSLSAFIGQSLRAEENRDFGIGSGLRDELSDVVGRLQVSTASNVDLVYRFRFDKDNFEAKRNELLFTGGPSAFRFHANYILIDQESGVSGFDKREELTLAASSRLSRNWSLNASAVRDLAEEEQRSAAFGVTYQDDCECARLNLTFQRSFTRDRDVEPSDTLFIRVMLRYLGEFQTAQSVGAAAGQ